MKHWFYLFIMLFFLFSCSENGSRGLEIARKLSRVKAAENFTLIQKKGFLELQIIDPEKKHVERRYAFVRGGEEVLLEAGVERIILPLKSLVCLSSTHIGMLNKIQSISMIKGIGSSRYVSNNKLLKNISAGKVEEFTSIDQLNPERLLQLGVQVVIYDGFGDYPVNEEKLRKLGIVCIPDYDWRETNPLGKAEWIKLFGVLAGKEKDANRYFEMISKEYLRLKKGVRHLKNQTSMISGSMIGDMWYMPAGQSFSANIFKDAQFDYREKKSKGTGSVSFSFEHCLKHHKNASLWINPGVISYKELLQLNPKYRFFKAFTEKQIYCYSHNANYFWENSAIEPQHVLSDYISLNKGEGSVKKLYFYRKLTL